MEHHSRCDSRPREESQTQDCSKKIFRTKKKEKEFIVQTYDSDRRLTESLATGVQKRTYCSTVDDEMPDVYDLMCAVLFYRRHKAQGLSKEDRKFSVPNLSIDFSLDFKTAMTYGGSGIFHNCTSMAFFMVAPREKNTRIVPPAPPSAAQNYINHRAQAGPGAPGPSYQGGYGVRGWRQ